MLSIITNLFTLEKLNKELEFRGLPKAPNKEVAALVIIKQLNPSNLNSWTKFYLDILDNERVNLRDLQAILDKAGATSPSAASNRLSMQRDPVKYKVKAEDLARNVPASGRTGRVKNIEMDLDPKVQAELEKYFAKAAK
jgi:hypothetical protein